MTAFYTRTLDICCTFVFYILSSRLLPGRLWPPIILVSTRERHKEVIIVCGSLFCKRNTDTTTATATISLQACTHSQVVQLFRIAVGCQLGQTGSPWWTEQIFKGLFKHKTSRTNNNIQQQTSNQQRPGWQEGISSQVVFLPSFGSWQPWGRWVSWSDLCIG